MSCGKRDINIYIALFATLLVSRNFLSADLRRGDRF